MNQRLIVNTGVKLVPNPERAIPLILQGRVSPATLYYALGQSSCTSESEAYLLHVGRVITDSQGKNRSRILSLYPKIFTFPLHRGVVLLAGGSVCYISSQYRLVVKDPSWLNFVENEHQSDTRPSLYSGSWCPSGYQLREVISSHHILILQSYSSVNSQRSRY